MLDPLPGPCHHAAMSGDPLLRISPADLDSLMSTLEVEVLALSECLVSPGYRLELGGNRASGIHYNLSGCGRIVFGGDAPIDIRPHTLVVAPANAPFRIEASPPPGRTETLRPVDGHSQVDPKSPFRRYVAGDGPPEILLICGYFRASYGAATDLFDTLATPIVEQFDDGGRVDRALRAALEELMSQEIGSGAMSAALLKQVIVAILRRSLSSLNVWVERFALLRDPRIAHAFAEMASRPGADHTVNGLADSAGLSRSAFMARFTALVGQSPMAILRDLRMRQAARQLKAGQYSVDQVAHNAGYDSRSSFIRAFRKAYDRDPADYRKTRE